jgi:Cu2+-exporting ATPase
MNDSEQKPVLATPSTRPGSLPGRVRVPARCLHCASELALSASEPYCCAGCRTVHHLLERGGLLRYYELRGQSAEPVADAARDQGDHPWLEPIAAKLCASPGGETLTFKLQGMRCAACVWLVQELFARQPGGLGIAVNPGRGSAELRVRPEFPLLAFVREVEGFGYRFGEPGSADDTARRDDELLLRTGICLALGGNAMMFAAAIYLGLADGPLYRLLHTLNFACATLAVLIGAPVFVRSALRALRARILHLDLPIAAGIVLTYSAAVWSFVSGNGRAAYYDSLATFIGLMLLGHWLKERIVLRNQRELLAESGAENVWARRVTAGRVELVRASALRAGDDLLVPAGDLVPVPSVLCADSAACSLDWINGESEPVAYTRGALIPAGAFNAGSAALRLRASVEFAESPLAALLARTQGHTHDGALRSQWFSGIYVIGVLAAACAGLAYWTLSTGDLVRGLEVATAICVVTCPCAIGIATPLAHDLVLASLRRTGLFVRTPSFLDRALQVKRVVFDKTGTLTTGRLQLVDCAPLDALSGYQRDVLYTLVAGSAHPKSIALQHALQERDARFLTELATSEVPGAGMQGTDSAHDYRLGQPAWVCGPERAAEPSRGDLVFGVDGVPCCVLATAEVLRADARAELATLAARHYDTWILSGDSPARVTALARELGVDGAHAIGGMSPDAKAQWIAEHDRGDLLMIGDGINDSLAVQRAFTSGTPSIDRAFMPWRTDFYFVTPGIAPIGRALAAARRLQRVVRGNQVFAVLYNVAAVAIALAGAMRPWMAAVLMPLSSIVVLAATSFVLSPRRRSWKS